MPRPWLCPLTVLLMLGAPVCAPAAAPPLGSGPVGIKPGLWDVRMVKQVVDGHDVSGQVASSLAQAQQLLSSLPPTQRQHLQALLNQSGVSQGENGSFRICVSPEMARRNVPFLDRSGSCRPVVLARAGNHLDFRFHCVVNGSTLSGQGHAQLAPDLVQSDTNVTAVNSSGQTHVLQNQTEMRYISADCGGLKPAGG